MSSKKLLSTTTNIREFAHALVEEKCIANPRFINASEMRREIRSILREAIADLRYAPVGKDDIEDRYDVVSKYAHKIQAVLVVLEQKYFGCDTRQLDPRVDDMDLDIKDLVDGFLTRKGVLPQCASSDLSGSENSDEE